MDIIIAPHVDDEVIGNYELLLDQNKKFKIIYTSYASLNNKSRINEAYGIKEIFQNIEDIIFINNPNTISNFIKDNESTLYFPDPIYEVHPHHRIIGSIGENILRENGCNVIFYSINMNAPYIHEVKNPNNKKYILDRLFPSQKNLWSVDLTKILFEGRVKWMI